MADNDNKTLPRARIKLQEDRSRTFFGRMSREPWIPVGAASTAFILASGLYQMAMGNKFKSQTMMRARIAAQGITIGAVFLSMTRGALAEKGAAQQAEILARHNARQNQQDQ